MMRRPIVTVLGVVVGAALFAYAVQRAGVDALADSIRRIGWGWLVILALAGARFALRAQSWRWCLPPGVRLDFGDALRAFLAGDAVGNVTPLGLLASEPTKVLLTRHRLATLESVASLALENLVYAVSVLAMVAFGLSLLLATVAVGEGVRLLALGTLGALVVAGLAGFGALRVRVDVGARAASSWQARLVRLRSELTGFARDYPGRLLQVLSLDMCFHLVAVAETWVTLQWLMGAQSPTAAQAVVFETVNRITIVLFKFVPFRIGVDEVASGAVAPLVAATAAAGVALAVVRKGRNLAWSGVGLLLIASHRPRG